MHSKTTTRTVDDVTVQLDVPCTMRDGTVLRADVYQPRDGDNYPVLLLRIPYDKKIAQTIVYQHPIWYAKHGYTVVVQDVRGRYTSEGRFDPLRTEAEDGYDAVQWAASLPRTSGKVGMYGFSYAGATQLLAATQRPPALACMVPGFTGSDYYDGWTYKGGALHHAFIISWVIQLLAIPDALKQAKGDLAVRLAEQINNFPGLYWTQPLKDFPLLKGTGVADYFFDWLQHDTRDGYWQSISLESRYPTIDVPCLHVGGWYDTFIEGTLKNFTSLTHLGTRMQRLLVGPWAHLPWSRVAGVRNFGQDADSLVDLAQLRWFDYWLKHTDNGVGDEAPVRVFTMGENRWHDAAAWPPLGGKTEEWFLHSDGRANSLSGDGQLSQEAPVEEPMDIYVYNPLAPIPSRGGASCCDASVTPMGSFEQTPIELRNDVLVYSSRALEQDCRVNGAVEVELYAASSAVDTDWTVKLVDVDEAGAAYNLCDGILRARFRDGFQHPKPLEPDQVYRYRIQVGSTSYLFKRGHRIRLEIASSNFPAHDINTNTGDRVQDALLLTAEVATQRIYHDRARASRLLLPVSA